MAILTLEEAIYAKLKADSTLTSLIGGATTPRIFFSHVPSKTPYPYVVYHLIDGRIPHDSPRQDADYLYQIEAWGMSFSSARAVHSAVYNVLNGNTLGVTGWSNYSSKMRGVIADTEHEGGKQYYRQGGEYQFLLAKI